MPRLRSTNATRPRSRPSVKQGRHVLPPSLCRSDVLHVRLLPGEKEAALAEAEKFGLDLATHVRRVLLKRHTQKLVPQPTIEMIQQLRRLGNNINQLTHLAHTGRINPRLGSLLEQVLGAIDQFHRHLLGFDDDRSSS